MTTEASSALTSLPDPVALLVLALAHMDVNRTYPLDAGSWSDVLLFSRDKLEREHPTYFRGFGFRLAPGVAPYCPEVSEFLTRMHDVAYHSYGSPTPGGGRITIPSTAQRELLASAQADVPTLAAARALAAALEARLI